MAFSAGVIHGQSPLDDTDHDRFPDIYETQMGGDAANPAITPNTAHANFITVNPAVPTSVPNRTYTTIQAAINAIPTNAYGIVWVKAGTYQEYVDIRYQHVLLIAELGAGPVILKRPISGGYNVIFIGKGDTVLEGLITDTTMNGETPVAANNVWISIGNINQHVAINNCVIKESNGGSGLWVDSGTAWVTHSTIVDNYGPYAYYGGSIFVTSNAKIRLRNSIVWSIANPTFPELGGANNSDMADRIQVTNSIIRGGQYGANANNPLLRPNIRDISVTTSPANNAGAPLDNGSGVSLLGASAYDLYGMPRSLTTPDIGAYEYTDTNANGLVDWWENLFFGNPNQIATADFDGDTLTNLQDYFYNFNPTLIDTDSDGENDLMEVLNSLDTDGDGMSDGFETQYTFDLNDPYDALEDADGDRIPNAFEDRMGRTNPRDALSKPAVNYTVDPSIVTETATTKKTITNAINSYSNNAGLGWAIIFVKSGTYSEYAHFAKPNILLLGESLLRPVTIASNSGSAAARIYNTNSVIDGFRLTHANEVQGWGVEVNLPTYPANAQARIVNCEIVNNIKWDASVNGAAIYVSSGTLSVVNSTIVGNTSKIGTHGIYLTSSSTCKLRLINNIIWNPSPLDWPLPVTKQVSALASQMIGDTSKNIMYGGEWTSLNADPLLDWDYRLRFGSPAINPTGSVLSGSVAGVDFQGEARDAVPDYGADEFIDTDADGLSDKWELAYFALVTTTNGDGDPDGDGLLNKWESLFDLNPTVADTDGNGLNDLRDALAYTQKFYTDTASIADVDGDGWSAIQELILGTSDTTGDSNGDGVSDSLALRLGISLTGTDPDGDGLTTTQELTLGTSPFLKDTDRDGVLDGADAFPFDRSRSTLSPGSGDVTVPGITLLQPSNATLIP